MVRTFTREGDVFDMSYSPKGDKIAACFVDKKVCFRSNG